MKRVIDYAALALAVFFAFVAANHGVPAIEAYANQAAVERISYGSTVKVQMDGGHGSGVHIGDGYILTAAHVVKDAGKADIKLDDGSTVLAGEVLWSNDAYDVALIRVDRPGGLSASILACDGADVGDRIEARGNPSAVEFVSMRGYIAGSAREFGPWATVQPTDMTIIGGMSGGGVFSEGGRVVGISVGGVAMGSALARSITGVTLIVPASTICGLLAR
jgi:S1-C subfamily serine protease